MTRVLLILSSVRPSRIGDQIANWILMQNRASAGLDIETVDLKTWHLPMDDEPEQPKRGGLDSYVQEHTREWSRKVQSGSGFIFLLPQYNWGYPASLKNALDHLYYEWADKPAVIVTYGSRGGGKAANQLAEVMQGIHLRPVETRPALPLNGAALTEHGRLADPAATFAPQEPAMRQALDELATALAVPAES